MKQTNFMGKLSEVQKFEKNEKFAENSEIGSKIASGCQFLKSIFRTIEIKDGNLGFLLHSPFQALQKSDVRQVWSG